MFVPKGYLYNLVTGKSMGPVSSFLRTILFLFSLVYGLAVIILAGFYRLRPSKLAAKVISVGNITLGGSGKTTFVEYLANRLNLEGKKVAILSRGYKRNLKGRGISYIGDEPAMLERKLPFARVVVNKNRLESASHAIKDYAVDTLILDDGMQQWRIFKDLEIITIDAGDPFGNYRMLPAGFLREPLGALRRSDVFVLTQCDPKQDTKCLVAKLRYINPRALIIESIHQPEWFSDIDNPQRILSVDSFKGRPVMIFSGIGNSKGFENTILSLGINIACSIKFADHHDYTHYDIYKIAEEAKEKNLETIITTEKDAVKIRELGVKGVSIWVLNIKLKLITNETEFVRRLLKLYSF